MYGTAAPVRPILDVTCGAPDVAVHMNKFNCQQAATGWNRERAKLVAFRAKTHRDCVKLDPGVWKTVIQCITDLGMDSFTKSFHLDHFSNFDQINILFKIHWTVKDTDGDVS